MKLQLDRVVDVTLRLTESEARWLGQLCGQIGGPASPQREFYSEVWRKVRDSFMAVGIPDIVTPYGTFRVNDHGTLCTTAEPSGGDPK